MLKKFPKELRRSLMLVLMLMLKWWALPRLWLSEPVVDFLLMICFVL